MIHLWFASPKHFKKFDFSKVGSGTGIARHGDGMYLGTKEVALEYLQEYRGFNGADLVITRNGTEVKGVARDVMTFLDRNRMDRAAAAEHFAGDAKALKLLDNPNLMKGVELEYGMLAEVKIPNYELSDFNHWDDAIDPEALDDIALKFLDRVVPPEALSAYAPQLEHLGVELPEDSTISEVIDDLFDVAYDEAIENGDLGWSVDEDDMRECWMQIVRQDDYSDHDMAGDFHQSFPKEHLDLLRELCKDGMTLEKDSDLSYGSIYELTSNQIDILRDKGRAPAGISAPELMTGFGIAGLRANALKANADTEELVIYSREVAESAKITPGNTPSSPSLGL